MYEQIAAALAAQDGPISRTGAFALLLCLLLAASGFIGWDKRSTGYKIMTIVSFVGILAIIVYVAGSSGT